MTLRTHGQRQAGNDFDLNNITSTEFYVCLDMDDGEAFFQVPVDGEVQQALRLMLSETLGRLGLPRNKRNLPLFQPAEKYSAEEALCMPIAEDYLRKLRDISSLINVQSSAAALDEPQSLVYYFALFRDEAERKLFGFRRATQFKGVVKARLLKIIDDTLRFERDKVFKLDANFDYLIFDETVFILHPSGFEFTADIGDRISQSVPENIARIAGAIPFVSLEGIESYAKGHKRAARILAALRSRSDLNKIGKNELKGECKKAGVRLITRNMKLLPDNGKEYDFLCVLDRRLYSMELIPEQPETYEAMNRSLRT